MDYELPSLRRDEVIALRLRALYEQQGYRLFRMGSFEAYDLYMQNKSFLMGEDIITFTAADGRLMALKPDVTLSIVKNTPAGESRRLYYHETVFRRSRRSGEYREINQMGLECIGGNGADEAGVLLLAAQSLAALGNAFLDMSHMGFIGGVLQVFADPADHQEALEAFRAKSPHALRAVAQKAQLPQPVAQAIVQLATLAGPVRQVAETAKKLEKTIAGTMDAAPSVLDDLVALAAQLEDEVPQVTVRLDFSILNDADYYNGLIFQGYAQGAVRPVLAGGRYDNLLRRFGKPQQAVGFALYLDALAEAGDEAPTKAEDAPWLNLALPKGRMAGKVCALLQRLGYSCEEVLGECRRLVFENEKDKLRYFLVKPTDVDIYVEHGVADIGVVGKDVLLESGADVLELLDLGLGRCRFAVAGPKGFVEDTARPLRVATKYPAVARGYYAAQSREVRIIKLHGSIELAPLVGLADVIVDIVETGSTLKENGLQVLAEVAPSSARLIANRASWRFSQQRISALVESLRTLL